MCMCVCVCVCVCVQYRLTPSCRWEIFWEDLVLTGSTEAFFLLADR